MADPERTISNFPVTMIRIGHLRFEKTIATKITRCQLAFQTLGTYPAIDGGRSLYRFYARSNLFVFIKGQRFKHPVYLFNASPVYFYL